MRLFASLTFVIWSWCTSLAQAETGQLQTAMSDGVHACQKWILDPKSWAEDNQSFAYKIGLGDKLIAIGGLPIGVLPTELMSQATNFWRLNGGNGNGIFVVASNINPVCNVAGGGPSDLQPAAESIVSDFKQGKEWKEVDVKSEADMTSSNFVNKADNNAEMVISRATKAGGRTDRVQFLTTVFYKIRK
ncbi:hypothetical protein [Sphingobium fluviale]|uniref:Uncharacterized protein n=1 Tax=Sphingobium fluviale TaxID=2506423 RepID=A0A4Q1KHZ6_9SPHN|nr:hypothetical protein [Sphingobium fluviale]RXR29227.1 hypothetical protein EQG66_06975 [Sphingobium fluviale]